MKVNELILLAVAGWTVIGVAGIGISLARGRRAEARRHSAWLAGVLGLYMAVLLGASAMQPQNVVPVGKDQCFGTMCFAVTAVDEVPGLVRGDSGRVVRVAVRVTNHGRTAESETRIEAYLVDSRRRVWRPIMGLSGNRLDARVAQGAQVVSEPMFQVAPDSTGLALVLTHGDWQPGRLTIGDSDSWGHRRTIVPLGQ